MPELIVPSMKLSELRQVFFDFLRSNSGSDTPLQNLIWSAFLLELQKKYNLTEEN